MRMKSIADFVFFNLEDYYSLDINNSIKFKTNLWVNCDFGIITKP